MYGYIYKTTNLVNSKVYIGQHKGRFNPNYFGSSKSLKRDIIEKGHTFFKLEIIDYANDKQELDVLEIRYIVENREKFDLYNITSGGGGKIGLKGPNHKISEKLMGNKNSLGMVHSEETKRKMSKGRLIRKALYGYLNSPETREKMRIAKLGKTCSKETREKMSLAHRK